MCSSTTAERQSLASRDRTCCLRRCLPARPLRYYGFRGSTAHPTIAVYASHPPSPATTQHSLPGARYGLPAPVSHRQDNASLPGAQAIHRRHQKESWIASSQGLLAKTSPNCRHTTCAADTHQRPAARHARDFARNVPPLKQRAWGMPGARCTRSPLCNVESTGGEATGTPASPGIPARNGFNSLYRALPGDRPLLPPSPADLFRLTPVGPTQLRELDASVG